MSDILGNNLKAAHYIEHLFRKTKKLLFNIKVKESRNRPGVVQRVPRGVGSQIFMTFGT
jgi:hypothetical protein